MVTTASKISPLNGLKTTHWYLTGNVTNPVPSRIIPLPMFSIPVTATTNPCRPLCNSWKPKSCINTKSETETVWSKLLQVYFQTKLVQDTKCFIIDIVSLGFKRSVTGQLKLFPSSSNVQNVVLLNLSSLNDNQKQNWKEIKDNIVRILQVVVC